MLLNVLELATLQCKCLSEYLQEKGVESTNKITSVDLFYLKNMCNLQSKYLQCMPPEYLELLTKKRHLKPPLFTIPLFFLETDQITC